MRTPSRDTSLFASGWMMRPATALTVAYGGVIAVWFLWVACTMKFPGVWHEGARRLIPTEQYLPFTIANGLLLLSLLFSLRSSRRAARGLRGGQAAGALLGIVLLLVLQLGGQALHRAWPGPVVDAAGIEDRIRALPASAETTVERVRGLLAERLAEVEERWMSDALHFRQPSDDPHNGVQGVVMMGDGNRSVQVQLDNVDFGFDWRPPYLPPGIEAHVWGSSAGLITVALEGDGLEPGSEAEAAVRLVLRQWVPVE